MLASSNACFWVEMHSIREVKWDIGSLFITWQLGRTAKSRPVDGCVYHTHTHSFQTMRWQIWLSLLLCIQIIDSGASMSLSSWLLFSCGCIWPERRYSICLLISFPCMTSNRLSCVPLPYFTPFSTHTVKYSRAADCASCEKSFCNHHHHWERRLKTEGWKSVPSSVISWESKVWVSLF